MVIKSLSKMKWLPVELWNRQGVIVTVGKHDQYLVRINGTGRVTVRNQRLQTAQDDATCEQQEKSEQRKD